MNDERLLGELNQIKKKVFLSVVLATIILAIIKLIFGNHAIEGYYVELFIIIVYLIGTLYISVNKRDVFDERVQQKEEFVYSVLFFITIYGGFAIHFYSVSRQMVDQSLQFNITSILMLIGMIVFIVLLRKNQIYANYIDIDLQKNEYFKKRLKTITIFSLLFMLNIFFFEWNSFNISYGFYFFENASIWIGLLLIIISLISIISFYLIFVMYEKNHYDESLLAEQNKRLGMTKNATLFLILPFIFSVITFISNTTFIIVANEIGEITVITSLSNFNKLVHFISFDSLISYLLFLIVVYYFIKKYTTQWINILKLLKTFIIYTAITVISEYYFTFIFLPLILIRLEPSEINIFMLYRLGISQIVMLISVILQAIIIYNVARYNVKHKSLLLSYIAFQSLTLVLLFSASVSLLNAAIWLSIVRNISILISFILLFEFMRRSSKDIVTFEDRLIVDDIN